MSESILQKLALVDVFVGPRSDDYAALTLSQRVLLGVENGAIEPQRFKAFANEYPDVLLTILRLAGVGEIGRRADPADAAYWQGVEDFAKTIIQLSALEAKDATTRTTDD